MASITEMFIKGKSSKTSKKYEKVSDVRYKKRINKEVKNESVGRIQLNEYFNMRGISLKKASEISGIDAKSISKWVNGTAKPNNSGRGLTEKFFGVKKNLWDIDKQDNRLFSVGLELLKIYIHQHEISFNELSKKLGINVGNVSHWIKKDKIPTKHFHNKIYSVLGISDNLWDMMVDKKQLNDILSNENNIPWKKNKKVLLRKKKIEKEYNNVINDEFIHDIVQDDSYQYHDIIQPEIYQENNSNNNIIHFSYADNEKERCEKCNVKKRFNMEYCSNIMFSITGYNCLKTKNDKFLYFTIDHDFIRCEKRNIHEGQLVYEIETNEKFIIDFVFENNSKYRDKIIVKNENDEEFVRKINEFKIKVNE